MLGLGNRLPLNFDSLGMTLNRIEGLLSEILGSAIAARIMFSAPASPATLFRVESGGIVQERALSSAPTSPGALLAITSLAALLATLSGVLSRAFSETKDDLGFNTGNASAAYSFTEILSGTRGALPFNLGLPGLPISSDSDGEEVIPEVADGCSD